jgi:hypothetical protein
MKWLFLIHRVQTPNSRERVKVWRLTKKVGAILYRNSAYVLPHSKERLEDFQWLCQEIRDSQGEASVFVAESPDEAENQSLKAAFNSARESDCKNLSNDAEKITGRIRRLKGKKQFSESAQKSLQKEVALLEQNCSDIERIDFFGVPLMKKMKSLIDRARRELAPSGTNVVATHLPGRHRRESFQAKRWTTREHIHIDRLCSAWLIRRFIDPKAKFIFAPESKIPHDAIPFDVFRCEFGHHGEDCTFETLLHSFRIKDKALTTLAQIIHDIDMKDNKFARSEATGLDMVVRALSNSLKDDHKTLEVGSVMLDALYSRLASKRLLKNASPGDELDRSKQVVQQPANVVFQK